MKIIAKKTLAVLCILAFFAGGSIVYAVRTLSWNQNPTVPPPTIDFSVSSIADGSNQTNAWIFDYATNSFTMPITIANNGQADWIPTITSSSVPSGWAFSYSALSAIAVGGHLDVTLTLHYSTGVPSTGSIGAFSVTIS